MSLRIKLTLLLFALVVVVAGLSAAATHLLGNLYLAWLSVAGAALLPVIWLAGRVMRPVAQMLRALAGTVASYREGDFSLSLVADRSDELGALMTAHNELSAALREQRASNTVNWSSGTT